VEEAHKKNIVVEAELGVLSGVEDDLSIDEKNTPKLHSAVRGTEFWN